MARPGVLASVLIAALLGWQSGRAHEGGGQQEKAPIDQWDQIESTQNEWVSFVRELSEYIPEERALEHVMVGHQVTLALGHLLREAPTEAAILWHTIQLLEAKAPAQMGAFCEMLSSHYDNQLELMEVVPAPVALRYGSIVEDLEHGFIRVLGDPENPR